MFFFYYFAPAAAPSSHCKLSHAPAEKKGKETWAPATSSPNEPCSSHADEMIKSHLLSSDAGGEVGEEG